MLHLLRPPCIRNSELRKPLDPTQWVLMAVKFDVLIHRSEWTRGTGAPGPRWLAGCVGGWDDRTSGIPPFLGAEILTGRVFQ